jgi:hypothetical protein
VTLEEYCGPLVEGLPVHRGPCSDGVYGCSKCNAAIRSSLNADQRHAAGLEEDEICDACGRSKSIKEVWERPVPGEIGTTWMVCDACHRASREEEE